jgi:hypothetical protein
VAFEEGVCTGLGFGGQPCSQSGTIRLLEQEFAFDECA